MLKHILFSQSTPQLSVVPAVHGFTAVYETQTNPLLKLCGVL